MMTTNNNDDDSDKSPLIKEKMRARKELHEKALKSRFRGNSPKSFLNYVENVRPHNKNLIGNKEFEHLVKLVWGDSDDKNMQKKVGES